MSFNRKAALPDTVAKEVYYGYGYRATGFGHVPRPGFGDPGYARGYGYGDCNRYDGDQEW